MNKDGWIWNDEFYFWQKDNGTFAVLVNKQIYGRFLVQKCMDIKGMFIDEYYITHDEEEAFSKANKWLDR